MKIKIWLLKKFSLQNLVLALRDKSEIVYKSKRFNSKREHAFLLLLQKIQVVKSLIDKVL